MSRPLELPQPYERMPIVADEAHEILVMTWRNGGLCAPHDHGAAGGRVHVISGSLLERRYTFDGRSLVVVSEQRFDAPAVIEMAPEVIHDMRASSGTVTVHHYTPKVEGMRVYDAERRETLLVSDDCGAWIPSNADDIRARESWS